MIPLKRKHIPMAETATKVPQPGHPGTCGEQAPRAKSDGVYRPSTATEGLGPAGAGSDLLQP